MPETIKVYPATKAQVAAVDAKVTAIDAKIEPISLANVHTFVLDFVYDPIMIISGGLDTYSRTISN